ncbi:MAG: hypothetical protein ABSA94_06145 [Acidobacteriaceae bacterium]|jgi:hypothetical protein
MAVLPASEAAEALTGAAVATGVADIAAPQDVQNEVAGAFSLPQAGQVMKLSFCNYTGSATPMKRIDDDWENEKI